MESSDIICILLVVVAIVALGVATYAGVTFESKSGGADSSLDGQEVRIVVADSLREVFDKELVPMFEGKYSGVKVSPVHYTNESLKNQIEDGLEGDVFMSDSNKDMDSLAKKGFIDNKTKVKLLENKIVLVAKKDDKSGIKSFEDLNDTEDYITIASLEVPEGQYAKEVLVHDGVFDDIYSKLTFCTDVTTALNQVSEGVCDYCLGYKTSVKNNNDVKIICESDDGDLEDPIIYPVAMFKDAKNQDAAEKFIEFLQTQDAKDQFKEYGFTIYGE